MTQAPLETSSGPGRRNGGWSPNSLDAVGWDVNQRFAHDSRARYRGPGHHHCFHGVKGMLSGWRLLLQVSTSHGTPDFRGDLGQHHRVVALRILTRSCVNRQRVWIWTSCCGAMVVPRLYGRSPFQNLSCPPGEGAQGETSGHKNFLEQMHWSSGPEDHVSG